MGTFSHKRGRIPPAIAATIGAMSMAMAGGSPAVCRYSTRYTQYIGNYLQILDIVLVTNRV